MLCFLRVENVAVIERLEIDFEPGLNLLTGETGAGKSILIDALGLVLGNRTSSELLRTGSESAVVEAGLEVDPLPDGLVGKLEAAGIEPDTELVIRREVSRSGRGKVILNGVASSRAFLREIAPFLVDIHGQGENLSLLRPEAGLELLDRFGGSLPLRAEVGAAFATARSLESELERLQASAEERRERRRFLEMELGELDKAQLREGEDEELAVERQLVAHAARLKELSERAYGLLYEDEASVLSRLALAFRDIASLADIDERWKASLPTRDTVVGQLEDLALSLRDYREQVEVTPGKLDAVESRLALLERLKKKYGGTLEAVLERRERCREDLEELESSGESIRELSERVEAARAKYESLSGELSKMRRNAARRLEKAVSKELPSLALEKARFAIELEGGAWRPSGIDSVELVFSANPGETPRPLARVASGGELSRFMLALKAVSAKGEAPKVLVFDEVDAGIGGRVADTVGAKLCELSEIHQVICVTHLPQIASFAPAHYRIDKIERRGRTETRIARLDREAQVEEIARMLAGAVVTESAREHARQLVTDKTRSQKPR